VQLSVVIVNYNTFELTAACIQSVIQHTHGLAYEIILVDNASTECEACLFEEKFPGIRVLAQSENLGFAGGNNAGIAQARGEVILLLNSDTLLLDNALLAAYEKIQRDTKIGALSVQLIFPTGEVQSCCQRFPSVTLELLELLRLQKLVSARQRAALLMGAFFNHRTEAEPDWVWATFFMFRRSILDGFAAKKLPDDFFMYGEDMQWCYLIRKKLGLTILYFPAAKVVHYLSASTNKNLNLNKQRAMIANEYAFIRKYYGNAFAWMIFKLRAIKYWSLSCSQEQFKPLVGLYSKTSDFS
jgi:hypothetical protein